MDNINRAAVSSSTTASPNVKNEDVSRTREPPAEGISQSPMIWIRTQVKAFDPYLFLLAAKGSLPLVVFLSMYQATPVARYFGNQTYIVAIVSTLSFAMEPRATFLRSFLIGLIFYCLAAGITCLGLWSARQAKLHTQPLGSSNPYNSSAAAVSAIFLFFNLFGINAFRAWRPGMMVSIINYAIFTNACFTQGYMLPDELPIYFLPKQFIINYLLALGLALGVNILILPLNSRTFFFKSYYTYLEAAKNLLKAYTMFLTSPQYRLDEHEHLLMKATSDFRAALVKLSIDKSDATAELAYDFLSPDELLQLYEAGQKIASPLLGLEKIGNIIIKMKRGEMNHCVPMNITEDDIIKALAILDQPCHEMDDLCQEGIQHVLCSLKLCDHAIPSDVRRHFPILNCRRGLSSTHLDHDFVPRFNAGLEKFWEHRTEGLADFHDDKTRAPSHVVFILIFNRFLLHAAAEEIRSLILLVDSFRNRGVFAHRRIIFPKLGYLREAILKLFRKRKPLRMDGFEPLYFRRRERSSLIPTHYWSILRDIFAIFETMLNFLRSSYALFGLRAALAGFVAALPAYLQSSATFYGAYRGVWSTIVIVISLGPTTGASLNGLLSQCLGTVFGGLVSMAVWYMVDQKVAGVIVLSYIVTLFHLYFFLQDRRRIPTILNSFATYVNVVGYALEVAKIGVAAEEETGQTYLPVYKLAPLRILVTIIGIALAFVFTLFPIPITSKDLLRRDMAQQFRLLASLFSLTQARLWAESNFGGTKDSQVLRNVLATASLQYMSLQAQCTQNLVLSSWEPNFRYQFPKSVYMNLLNSMQSIHDLYLIQNDVLSRLQGSWLESMSKALGTDIFRILSVQIITILTLLSSSLSMDTPIPPFRDVPRAALHRALATEREPEEMSLEHVGETGYSVYAAMSVSTQMVVSEVEECVLLVRSLVGEVDLALADKEA